MKFLLFLFFGLFYFFSYSKDYTLRFYVNTPKGLDSADFSAHLDPMHITHSNYILCAGKKYSFHRVYVKSDSLFAEVNDFPVVFRFLWNHKASVNPGVWTSALKPGFKGKVAMITHPYHPSKNTSSYPQGKYQIDFQFKTPLKGTLYFTPLAGNSWVSVSLLTPSGDFGFIQGYFINDSLYAASFNGSGFFIIKGRFTKFGGEGIYITEKGDVFPWNAHSESKPMYDNHSAKFILPVNSFSLNGKPINFNHDSLRGKPLVIHILGSWCHNCRDEVLALKEFVQKYSSYGVRFYAIAVEKQPDTSYVNERIRFVRERWGVSWPMLSTGKSTKDNFSEWFGMKETYPYPTMFLFDEKHQPVKMHVGFSGPATGKAFEEWKAEFNNDLKNLLK
jgi:thiol-disulfide isomerase/thioredoxin